MAMLWWWVGGGGGGIMEWPLEMLLETGALPACMKVLPQGPGWLTASRSAAREKNTTVRHVKMQKQTQAG